MTNDEILTKLDELSKPGDFLLTKSGGIRSSSPSSHGMFYCPLCWLAKQLGLNPSDEAHLPRNTNLEYFGNDILHAADNNLGGLTRKRLLAACKLAD